jgi:Protein of unknown function (DUF3060)
MKPEDDPEARIRELERPLADTARASELGSAQTPGGYPYPPGPAAPPLPPPPPFNYGTSLPRTSLRSPALSRMLWIFIALFIIGPIALAAAISYNTGHQFSRGLTTLSPAPSVSPSTVPNSLPNNEIQTPGAGPSTAPPSKPLPPVGGNLSAAGINESQTIACNDSIVNVSGISNTVVLTGHCKSLDVSGVQNKVTVDAVDTIEASGFNNRITYHTGSPSIDKSGDGNVVQQG